MTNIRWTGPQETMAPYSVLTTVLHVDGQQTTLYEYLAGLLRDLWRQGPRFEAKRPYGDTDWQWQVYEAMAKAQLIDAWWSPEGALERIDRRVADAIIEYGISVMTCMSWPKPSYEPCVVHQYHKPAPKVNEIHHIWPLEAGGPDTPQNTIVVCPNGHRAIHRFMEILNVHEGKVPFRTRSSYATAEIKCAWQGYKAIQQGLM